MTHFVCSWIEFLNEARKGDERQSYMREKLENKKELKLAA